MKALPEAAYATALAALPEVGPGWLAEVLEDREPSEVWRMLGRTELARLLPPGRRRVAQSALPKVMAAARCADVAGLWSVCRRSDIGVTWVGHPSHPSSLAQGPAPCAVLFWRGERREAVDFPLVAIVGTRRCTPAGAALAREIGYELSIAGVGTVSGLALGIDGAAHAGAVAAVTEAGPAAAGTVGIAASGVDVVYPRQHRHLWDDVAATGTIVSETPPGKPAQAWRFPSRNRLIAGLSRLVVVVESHARGGTWHTVEAAIRRGTDVGAVPGPVHSPASAGTNKLLFDGALVVRSAQDVLGYLGMAGARPAGGRPTVGAPLDVAVRGRPSSDATQEVAVDGTSSPQTTAEVLAPVVAEVRRALGWAPMCLDEIVERAGLPVAAVAVALEQMEGAGEVAGAEGFWSRL